MSDFDKLVASLNLVEHPEGLRFLEVYRSTRQREVSSPNPSGDGDKSKLSDGTSVYVMIKDEMFVSWHKLMCSDILFFWHRGNTLKVHEISPDGTYRCQLLGDHFANKEAQYQINVNQGHWYATELVDQTGYSLWSEVVIPGFALEKCQLATRDELVKLYPQHSNIIARLTRE